MFNFLGQPANPFSQVPVTSKLPSTNRMASFNNRLPTNQLPQQNMFNYLGRPASPMSQVPFMPTNQLPQQNMFSYLGTPANPMSQVPMNQVPMTQKTSSFRPLMPGLSSPQTNRTFMNSPSLFNTGFGR